MGALALIEQALAHFSAWSDGDDRVSLALVQLQQAQDTRAHERFTAEQHALVASIAAAKSRGVFTDAEMAGYAAKLPEGITQNSILLRSDAALMSIEQLDNQSRLARLEFVESRVAEMRQLLQLREEALAIEPKLRRYWTDALNDEFRDLVRQYDGVIDQVRNGTFPLRDVLAVVVDMVRFLPVSFGDTRELSEDVVQYAAQHGLSLPLVTTVVPMLKTAFVQPRNLQASVVEDEDTDDDWIDIELDVSDDTTPGGEDPAQRYLALVRALYSAAPPTKVNRLRFSYRVR